MSTADILIRFTLCSHAGSNGQTSEKRFTDWYDFADFLKQENEAKRDVIIHDWKYVHAIKRED